MRVLYVTVDGLLQPLGYSQVVRLVKGLAGRGVSVTVLSMERSADLERVDERLRVQEELAQAGVAWRFVRYADGSSASAAVRNLLRGMYEVLHAARGVEVVHARSYVAGILGALVVRGGLAGSLLFDTRAYWVEERREEGRWFSGEAAYRAAKQVERFMYQSAGAVVTLTELAAEDVRAGRFGRMRPGAEVVSIPTIVDFDEFNLERRQDARRRLAERTGPLEGPVVGFVGSVNGWYDVEASVDLIAMIHQVNPRTRVVVLSSAWEALSGRLRNAGVPREALLCSRADHREMPEWLASLDWGLLLLGVSPAKRASMPTKLGEFFAAGVRPIHAGCNEEVADWVRRTGSGVSLPDLSRTTLRRTAEEVALGGRDEGELSEARERARPHFALEAALDAYERLLSGCLVRGSSAA